MNEYQKQRRLLAEQFAHLEYNAYWDNMTDSDKENCIDDFLKQAEIALEYAKHIAYSANESAQGTGVKHAFDYWCLDMGLIPPFDGGWIKGAELINIDGSKLKIDFAHEGRFLLTGNDNDYYTQEQLEKLGWSLK